jgi:hypothetical protein
MHRIYHVLSIFTGIKFKYLNYLSRSARKVMSSIWKFYFSASFYWNTVELFQTFLEYIHHSYFICEANNNVEPGGMKSYTIRLVIEQLTNLVCNRRWVVPNSDSLIEWARGDQVFLYANIHPYNRPWMERKNKELIFWIFTLPVQSNTTFHDLAIFCSKYNLVFILR